MTAAESYFLTPDTPSSARHRALQESDLDDSLWLDPYAAGDIATELLDLQHRTFSPLMSRLALKALSIPLFVREHEADAASESVHAAADGVSGRTADLIDAYLDLQADESIDQAALRQGMIDASVFALGNDHGADVTLLPIAPQELSTRAATTFSVLRRIDDSLPLDMPSRTYITVTDEARLSRLKDREVDQYHRHLPIRNFTWIHGGAVDLAEAIVADANDQAGTIDKLIIKDARANLTQAITRHNGRLV